MSGFSVNIILDKEFNKVVPKPINNRPGYDMRYISTYMRNYSYGTDFEKMIKTEKLYDDLSIIGLHETPRQQCWYMTSYDLYDLHDLS